MLDCLKPHPLGTTVSLYIQPRSSKNQIVGLHGESLKVKLTSPPVEGAANKSCCAYLAKLFGVSKSEIELVSGEKARQKIILLHGLQPSEVEDCLRAALADS